MEEQIEKAAKPGYISDKAYNELKRTVQYILPALGTLYFTLAQIWGFPNGEQVMGSIASVTLFAAVFLGLSNKAYNASEAKYDGALIVDTSDPQRDSYSLNVSTPLDEVHGKDHILLKIDNVKYL